MLLEHLGRSLPPVPVAVDKRPIIPGVKATMRASRIATIAAAATST
jgi:hypothetical protein